MVWSLESRLSRPQEYGRRVLLGGDDAAACGSFIRGRSPSFLLNVRCRQSCAVQLVSDINPFFFYVHTKFNPAAAPSRVYCTEKGT